ncbi:MAG: nuclear transport factor 2 family protein [Candidatus Bathyarchaeia archaeon]
MSTFRIGEREIRERVYSFCQALAGRNFERLRGLLAENASLSWGPYRFDGKESILTWAKELFELFPFMAFKEKAFEVQGTTAKHEFMIAFITTDGQRGWLPCEGIYDFEDGLINRLRVKLLHGFLAVSRDDIERVRPHVPKQ